MALLKSDAKKGISLRIGILFARDSDNAGQFLAYEIPTPRQETPGKQDAETE
jgi:hypothetical protein